MRSFLYKLARILGDWSAVRRGRVGRRIYSRAKWRLIGRIFR